MFITIDEADFQQVVETWNQGFSDYLVPVHVDKEALEQRIQSLKLSKQLSAVFSIDGEFAGIILLGIQTFQQTKVMWVGGMAVVPKYRRNKVASQLIDYAEHLAKENACDRLMLEVIATNERAKKLYELKGFQVINELAVGLLNLPAISKEKKTITFKSVTPNELSLTEHPWTPWQNRFIFSDKNYNIYQDGIRLGSISFNVTEDGSSNILILTQFYLLERIDCSVVTAILFRLKEQEQATMVKLTNFDQALPEYQELEKIGITLQLTQFQMTKEINNGVANSYCD